MRPIGFEPIFEWLKVICITTMLRSLNNLLFYNKLLYLDKKSKKKVNNLNI